MKRNLFYIVLSIAMILTGCTQETEFGLSNVSGNYTLNAVIENGGQALSRTTVDENGQVLWSEADRIGVFGDKNTKNAPFTLAAGIGKASGSFKGNLPEGEEAETAYYPYSEDATLNGNTLTFTLPSEYTYAGNSNAPMLGVKDKNGNFQFKHLAGLLKIVVNSVPTGVSKFVIISEGEDAPALAGSAEVADIADVDNPVLTIKGKEEQSITYNLEGVTESRLTFFVPIPVGVYSRLSVKLLMEDGTELLSKALSNQEVKRAAMIVLPVLEAGSDETISPDYVAIDWNHAKIESMNLPAGEFTLAFSGNDKPDFEDGLSIVVLQTDTSAYLKRVMRSSASGNKVTLQTQDATMEELFRNTEFTLSIGEGAQTKLITSQGNIITPSKIVKVYEDNSYEVVYDETAMTRSDYVEIDPTLPIPIFRIDHSNTSVAAIWEEPGDGPTISAGVSLTAEKFVHSLTATYNMHFKFSPAVYEKKITDNLKVNVSEVEEFSYTPGLDFRSQTLYSLSANTNYTWKKEADITKLAMALYTFFIGPVPVFFTQDGAVKASLEIGMEGKVSAECGVDLGSNLTAGIKYEKGKGISPVIDGGFTPQIHPFKCQLGSSVYAKASVYPEVGVKLYGFIGPKFAIVPFVESRFSSTPLALSYTNWSNTLGLGVDVTLGGGVEFFNWEGINIEFTKNFLKGELYRAPKKIELIDPQNNYEVEVNTPVEVTFKVTDAWTIPFTEPKENPVEDALVQFKGTGNSIISQEYVWTDENGYVKTTWTPTSSGDVLCAMILDENKEILSEAYFVPKMEEPPIVGKWWQPWVGWTAEPPHSRIYLENVLEFYEDGTFKWEKNPTKKNNAQEAVDGETNMQIGWAIGTHYKIVKGYYTYIDGVIELATTYAYEDLNFDLYDLADNYQDSFTSTSTDNIWKKFVGPIEFIDENSFIIRSPEYRESHFERISEGEEPWLQPVTRSLQQNKQRMETLQFVKDETGTVKVVSVTE